MTHLAPATPPAAPSTEIRDHAINAAASLLRLYLGAQPRDLRRHILTAGRALGWELDRRTAADLVGELSDDTLRLIAAVLYDWSTDALALDDAAIELDAADPGLRRRALDELAGALARVSWPE